MDGVQFVRDARLRGACTPLVSHLDAAGVLIIVIARAGIFVIVIAIVFFFFLRQPAPRERRPDHQHLDARGVERHGPRHHVSEYLELRGAPRRRLRRDEAGEDDGEREARHVSGRGVRQGVDGDALLWVAVRAVAQRRRVAGVVGCGRWSLRFRGRRRLRRHGLHFRACCWLLFLGMPAFGRARDVVHVHRFVVAKVVVATVIGRGDREVHLRQRRDGLGGHAEVGARAERDAVGHNVVRDVGAAGFLHCDARIGEAVERER
mmetsp:Transcript_16657/g.51690  ORF Transcript_16657/g.51690 Transcript_16657/m.51690 type:complete len:262 (+) Transcript_16657:331-1116(+)